MKGLTDWLMHKWPTALGAVFGGAFAVIVGCMVLFPATGLLRCKTLWIVTGVVIGLWLLRRFTDGEAASRLVSDPLQVERADWRFARELTRDLVVKGLTDNVRDRITVRSGFRYRLQFNPGSLPPDSALVEGGHRWRRATTTCTRSRDSPGPTTTTSGGSSRAPESGGPIPFRRGCAGSRCAASVGPVDREHASSTCSGISSLYWLEPR